MSESTPEAGSSGGEVPDTEVGVGLTTSDEPNTFEPEEDPEAAAGSN